MKTNMIFTTCIAMTFFCIIALGSPASAQVLFDFNDAPQYTSLPIDQTEGGITAHFSAGFNGYSIQAANVLGFTPAGFDGRCIYPNSVYLTDLYIRFDQTLTHFNIMYCCQELGCDDAATMRVTAYKNGIYVGTSTKTASNPGTWPVDTLGCTFTQGFDSVVIHYDSAPPTCQDYGVIYLADNMWVTASTATAISDPETFIHGLIISNPVSQSATISFSLLQSQNIKVAVYDITGKIIKNLFVGALNAGQHQINWKVDNAVAGGVYFLNLTSDNFSLSRKLVVMK